MAGRGGRYPMSFSTEQLGLSKGDVLPTPVLKPPSSYPLLEHKPLPITLTNEMDYLVELKRNFAEFIHESSNNVEITAVKEDFERYTDRYENMILNKVGYELRYDWSKMPMELKPTTKRKIRRSVEVSNKRRKLTEGKVVKIKLERKTNNKEEDNVQQDNKEEKNKKEEEETEEKVDEYMEVEKVDEEMDGGTDYVDNFFDNGERYDDEDDNLDDGPVY